MAILAIDNWQLDVPDDKLSTLQLAFQRRDDAIVGYQKKIQKLKRKDSAMPDEEDDDEDCNNDSKSGTSYQVGDKKYDSVQQMQDAFSDLQKKMDEMENMNSMDKKDTKLDSMSGKVEALQAELALERQKNSNNDALKGSLKLRVEANKALPQMRLDALCEMSDRQVKELVVASKYPSRKDSLSQRSDEFIQEMFEVALESAVPTNNDANHFLQLATSNIQRTSTNPQDLNVLNNLDSLPQPQYVKDIEQAYNWINKI